MVKKVVALIIVTELLACWYDTLRKNKHTPSTYLHLAVRFTRMINVARLVPLRLPINGFVLMYLEKIEALARKFLLLRNNPTDIFNNADTLRNVPFRKKTQA